MAARRSSVRLGRSILFLSALLASALLGCGGGGGNFGPDLGGTVNTAVFTIPAGTTQRVTSDLVVNATDKIDIAGTMLIEPGVSVALLSDKLVTISGSVRPDTLNRSVATSRGREGGDGSFIFEGNEIDLPGDIKTSKNIYGCGTGAGPTLIIRGNIVTEDGKPGVDRSDPGDDGSSIEIGSDAAKTALQNLGKGCVTFKKITIDSTGSIKAGAGGEGFTDNTGVTTGSDVDYLGTDGGRGENIKLSATELVTGGLIKAGAGGKGGWCFEVFGKAKDGSAPGEKGGTETATTGNGGDGGRITLGSDTTSGTMAAGSGPGNGGNAGNANPEAGSGGPGGNGGDMIVQVGSPGNKGTGPGGAAKDGEAAIVRASGGNGGDSEDKTLPGGSGGKLTVIEKAGKPLKLREPTVSGLNGGFGFNGCGVVPQVAGTRGGNGGQVTSAVVFAYGSEFAIGGDGGDGMGVAGAAGTRGSVNGAPAGKDGIAGKLCTYTVPAGTTPGFLAVKMDYDSDLFSTVGGQRATSLVKGDTVPVCRIRYGHVSGPEPVVPEEGRGCAGMHLHTAAGATGIRVRANFGSGRTKWTLFQPIADKAQKKCGFGMLVVIPTCKITAKDVNLR